MVDKLFTNHVGFPELYKDMGDGTWAKVVSLGASASIDIGDVTLLAGSAVIGKVDHSTTGIGHGKKAVTTAGTDVALISSSTPAKWVTIQALRANTGFIAVGATGVDATTTTGDGETLAAGEKTTIPCDNLADIFIDSTVNGEGVRFTYGT
jgi:hypothetical protein